MCNVCVLADMCKIVCVHLYDWIACVHDYPETFFLFYGATFFQQLVCQTVQTGTVSLMTSVKAVNDFNSSISSIISQVFCFKIWLGFYSCCEHHRSVHIQHHLQFTLIHQLLPPSCPITFLLSFYFILLLSFLLFIRSLIFSWVVVLSMRPIEWKTWKTWSAHLWE